MGDRATEAGGTGIEAARAEPHVTFSGALAWPYVYPWLQRPAGLVEAAFDELAARWRPILDEFDRAGVDVCYELHPGEDLHNGVTFERFLAVLGDHPRANILFDPSHFVLQQLDYLAFIDIYHARIKAFHVKDAEFRPNGQQGVYGAVHRIAARLDDRYELVAGALSSDAQRAAASAVAIGLPRSYADWREMACVEAGRADGIEAVAIVTPNHLHAPVATAFLEAGIRVICDKPLAVSLAEAEALAKLAREKDRVFAVTYTYTGYPLVRHVRGMVRDGLLDDIRVIQVEYAQDWLALPVESQANRQAAWRTDPALAELAAEVTIFVENRRVDDHVQALLRYANGARGMLWASQVAAGEENALRLRVYGTKAGLAFDQEKPNELWFTPLGGASQRITRGRVMSPQTLAATRVPGIPKGYHEAFAQLYTDAAACIASGTTQGDAWLTTVEDGVAGLRFIDAVLRSSGKDGAWVAVG